jgi:hypothetical protein
VHRGRGAGGWLAGWFWSCWVCGFRGAPGGHRLVSAGTGGYLELGGTTKHACMHVNGGNSLTAKKDLRSLKVHGLAGRQALRGRGGADNYW